MNSPNTRLISLDVLRGLAILLMIFSGMLPKTLPSWLDHGYQPHYRPDAAGVWMLALDSDGNPVFDPRWKAFTWVDLVFPMFLFAMGAAIPLAMSRRLDRDRSVSRAFRVIAGRALMLPLFAVIVTQMTTGQLNWPHPDVKRVFVLIGFAAAFAFFVRRSSSAPRGRVAIIRIAALLVIVALIVACIVKTDGAFAWSESDTIILVLANTYLIAAGLWVLSRSWGWWRLVAVSPILLLAHYLQLNAKDYADWLWLGEWPLSMRAIANVPATVLNISHWSRLDTLHGSTAAAVLKPLLDFSPLWNFTWYKFLWVVIPGTVVGDRMLKWSRIDSVTRSTPLAARWILCLAVTVTAAVCVGLRHYGFTTLGIGGPIRTPWLALVLAVPLLFALERMVRHSATGERRRLYRWLLGVGAIALLAGLILACLPNPSAREGFFEGGISKGSPATVSYYATSVGLCTLLLLGLTATLDGRPIRRLGIIEANGQNPMLAYYLAHAIIGAVLSLGVLAWMGHPLGEKYSTIENLISVPLANSPWLYAIWAVAKTAAIAAFVWWLTRRRIFWRA